MKSKIKAKLISIIIGTIGIIAIDILIKCTFGESFILQIIKAL